MQPGLAESSSSRVASRRRGGFGREVRRKLNVGDGGRRFNVPKELKCEVDAGNVLVGW